MPVTLTTGQLAVEMRLSTDPVTVPTEYAEILTRALDTAKEHVEAYVARDGAAVCCGSGRGQDGPATWWIPRASWGCPRLPSGTADAPPSWLPGTSQ